MNRLLWVLAGGVIAASVSFVQIAVAQDPVNAVQEEVTNAVAEEAAPAVEDDNLMYTYGTVVSIAPEVMVINEYDFDSDSFKEVTYSLTADVQLSNVPAVTDIAAGDSVEVYYIVEGDKKIAKTIGKDEEDILDEAEEPQAPGEAAPAIEDSTNGGAPEAIPAEATK